MSYQIQLRADTSANWASANTVLAQGEPGLDTTLKRIKLGDGVTAWNSLGWDGPAPFILPMSSGWSALNSGSVSADVNGRKVTLVSGALGWTGELRTLTPSSNYTATFYFDWGSPGIAYSHAGIILKNSGGNQIITFGPVFDTVWLLRSTKWDSVTTFNANYAAPSATSLTNGIPNWLRIRDDTTTRIFEYSYNGIDWVTQSIVGRTDFITPNQIGWGGNSNNAGGSYTAITRLRHFSGV